MRVLVTGHDGYIGAAVVRRLLAAGHEVRGLDAFFYEGCELFPPRVRVPALRLDIRDARREHLEGVDAVVHLAALSNDPLGAIQPDVTREINHDATVALALAAKQADVGRFVFASSCSMYGAAGPEPVTEEAPLRPLTAYSESKARSEEALRGLADGGFVPVLMRNATAYGVSPRMRVDLVLNNLVGWALTTGKVRILSDGTPWRPLIHIEDIARATLAMLEAPAELVAGEAFNTGADSENYQVRDLAEIVHEAVAGCEIEYAGTGEPDRRSYRVDFGKFARAFPGLLPRWTARTGAEEIAAAYRESGLTFEIFQGPRYTRLKHLERLLARARLDERLRWRRVAA